MKNATHLLPNINLDFLLTVPHKFLMVQVGRIFLNQGIFFFVIISVHSHDLFAYSTSEIRRNYILVTTSVSFEAKQRFLPHVWQKGVLAPRLNLF